MCDYLRGNPSLLALFYNAINDWVPPRMTPAKKIDMHLMNLITYTLKYK